MSALSLRLPTFLHTAAREIAKKEHISVNQFITLAVAEKISALGTADYIDARTKRGDRAKFLAILKKAPDIEPDDFDKL